MAEIQGNLVLIRSQLQHLSPNLMSEPRACLKQLFLDFESRLNDNLKEQTLELHESIIRDLSNFVDSFHSNIPLFDPLGDGSDVVMLCDVENATNGMQVSSY